MVKKDPEDLDAWMKLGNIYFEHNRYPEAIEAYSQYLSLKPVDPDIRTNMGIMLSRLGDYDGAIEEFRKAAESDTKHMNSWYYLGFTLLHDKQNPNEAIKAWEDYLKVEPKGERANQVRVLLERLKEELVMKQ
jgi:cytochrome c-type biogenesis protein CcmH/NrfG